MRSITQILVQNNAKDGDHWIDEFGNIWEVKIDRDGFRLEGRANEDDPHRSGATMNAVIPYWTCFTISLPGFIPLTPGVGE